MPDIGLDSRDLKFQVAASALRTLSLDTGMETFSHMIDAVWDVFYLSLGRSSLLTQP